MAIHSDNPLYRDIAKLEIASAKDEEHRVLALQLAAGISSNSDDIMALAKVFLAFLRGQS